MRGRTVYRCASFFIIIMHHTSSDWNASNIRQIPCSTNSNCFGEIVLYRKLYTFFFLIAITAFLAFGDACKKLNGKIFKVKDMMPGKNAPPMHPRCHCCTAPHWDEAKFQAYLREENRKMHQRKGVTYATKSKKHNTQNKFEIFTVEDCLISERRYSFPDGYGGVKEVADAIVYTASDKTKFIFPKKYNKAHQTMTPYQAIECWNRVPDEIRNKAQKKIVFVDYYNPADDYWKKVYKNFPHSYATGGDIITFYRYDVQHDSDYVVRTYCHEAGHFIDMSIPSISGRYCTDFAWTKAMTDDIIISKKISYYLWRKLKCRRLC